MALFKEAGFWSKITIAATLLKNYSSIALSLKNFENCSSCLPGDGLDIPWNNIYQYFRRAGKRDWPKHEESITDNHKGCYSKDHNQDPGQESLGS